MKKLRTLGLWVILIVLLMVIYNLVSRRDDRSVVEYEVFLEQARTGEVAEIWIDGNEITVELYGTETYLTYGVVDKRLAAELSTHGVKIHWEAPKGHWLWILVAVGIVAFAVFIWAFRRASGKGAGGIMELRLSKARRADKDATVSKTTFGDVGGAETAKSQMRDVIDYLKHPKRWQSAGVRLPHGVLLEGPPGCGKTLLGKAVAGEAGVPFFFVSASEFVELFVGVGASRVRDTFEKAQKAAPSIIFIDELDAVARRRGSGLGSAHDEREQTLNQLLVSLDGFETKDNVVVIAATNRPDVLDKALTRPGRLDWRIKIEQPNLEERIAILEIHMRNKKRAADASLSELASSTSGFNGADLENLANEAALMALRRARQIAGAEVTVNRQDLLDALAAVRREGRVFDQVDAVLIESASQLARPTGKAVLRVTLRNDQVVAGEVVWADATFIKLKNQHNGEEIVIPKQQVRRAESLGGTDQVQPGESVGDVWAGRSTELA